MKRTPSSILALANLLLLAILPVSMWVLFTRFDPLFRWHHRWLERLELGIVPLVFVLLFVVPLVTLTLSVVDVWQGFRRQALLSAAISLVLIFTVLLWLGFGDRLASSQEVRADRAWAKTLEPMDAFLTRFPEAPDSESAIRLRAAAARIGVALYPYDTRGAQPVEADHKAFQAVQKRLLAFVSSQRRKADDALDAPAPEVAAWVSAHDAGIAALVGDIRSGGPIAFATDWSSARREDPALFGMMNLASVIILRALERERLGDSQAASEALEASWSLGGALRERGELISQLVALDVDSRTFGALRRLRDPPGAWRARVVEPDYRRSTLRALEGEAWFMAATINGSTAMDQMRRRHGRGLFVRMKRPYLRLMASDSSLALARMVADLKRADPCRTDGATLDKMADGSVSPWNFLGKIGVPSGVRAWAGAVRTDLEAELTRNVLAARQLRKEQGTWPSDLPGLESSVCRGARWDYSTTGGHMSLSIRADRSLGPPLAFRAGAR